MTTKNLQIYAVWAISRVTVIAVLAWWPLPLVATFVAGFATCEIAYWRVKAREQHWREMAGKMAERNRELQAAENARTGEAARARIAADKARMHAEVTPMLTPREAVRQQVQQQADLLPKSKRKDVH